MDIYIQELQADFTSFLIKKTLVRVINKHYGHSMKGILSKPTRRFPHTRVSCKYPSITYNRGIKPWVLDCTQQDLPDKRKIKDSKDMQGLFSLWVIASVGSITKCASLYSILLAVIISSLTNHSMCRVHKPRVPWGPASMPRLGPGRQHITHGLAQESKTIG